MACWEVALLVFRRQLDLSGSLAQWFDSAFANPSFELAPLTPNIAIRSVELDWPNRDPADRLIIATAIELGVPLVTRDERIVNAAIPGLKTVW